MIDQQAKVADAAAIVSGAGAITSWVVNAMPIVQFIAAVVAIFAGTFAAIYHYKKIRELNGK
jgi:uncharacterized membrane protein